MTDDLMLWMWLENIFGTANPRKWEVTARFSSIEECYDAFVHGDHYGLNEREISNIKRYDPGSSEKILEYCQKNGINIYCYESEDFPERLREIYDPPAVLYVKHKGASLDFLNESVTVAIVGARNVDDYYLKVTEEISGQLAAAGAVVISGFAVGADTAAHRAAMENGGKTVAVLGSGIEYDYPRGTMDFKSEISENGAVISEFPPDHVPMPKNFVARNRILSGLSMGILVTQASPTSGSLNTVSHGVSQGKDIFCVPPKDIFNNNYRGVVQLIRDGAVPVFDARDIIYEYYENYSHRLDLAKNMQNYSQKSKDSSIYAESVPKRRPQEKQPKEKNDNIVKNAETDAENEPITVNLPDLSGLSPQQVKIIHSLEKGGLLADEISRETGIDIMELFSELTELEILGYVRSLPGNRYSL